MKTYSWIGKNGNLAEIEAECTMETRQVVLDSDGWKIPTNKDEVVTHANLILKVDGKKVGDCWDVNFWRIIDSGTPGVKRIWGIQKVGFSEERGLEIEKFLNEVIESGKSESVKAFEAAEVAARRAEDVKTANRIIAKSKKTIKNSDGSLMTESEAAKYLKIYNDINNEGGEGYLPEITTQEQYDYAMEILNQ